MENEKTLIDKFIPPEDYEGEFGVMTTMTHDDDTLKLIIENFTAKSINTLKTIDNQNYLFLVADGKSEAINYSLISGLQKLNYVNKKRLLHAKMALLKFNHTETKTKIYRLIVLTGNYTQASLSRQIEMVWSHDYAEDTEHNSDLCSAADFLKDLIDKNTEYPKVLSRTLERFLKEINSRKVVNKKSRFIHSLNKSLQSQVLKFCKRNIKLKNKHNYIVFGSPFFQESFEKVPFIVNDFIDSLRSENILSTNSSFFLQSNASAINQNVLDAAKENLIEVSGVADDCKRVLHSKYIMISYYLNEYVRDNLIYIGSGNLTINGFYKNHNIETGIIFRDSEHYHVDELEDIFYVGKEIVDIENFEPTDNEDEISDEFNSYSLLGCVKDGQKLVLCLSCDPRPFTVLSCSNEEIYKSTVHDRDEITITLSDEQEVFDTLKVREDNGFLYTVPVMNTNGTFNKIEVIKAGFEDILSILKNFPNQDTVDEDTEFEQKKKLEKEQVDNEKIESEYKTFPLYNLSQLIEQISRENENVDERSVSYWSSVLKFALIDKLENFEKKKMARIGLDKLDFLLGEGFRPNIKKKKKCPYKSAIYEIKDDWCKYL